MKTKFALAPVLFLAVALSHCGGSKGSGNLVDAQDYWKLSGSAHQYWKSNCYVNPQSAHEYITTFMKFDATADFSQEDNVYSDAGCTNGLYVRTLAGTTKLTGRNKDVHEARDIEYKIAKADVKPTTQAGADYLISEKLCGIVAWKNNEVVSVLGFNCRGNALNSDQVVKDIIEVNATSMHMGHRDVGEGLALDMGRPNKLNNDVTFSKENSR